MANGAGGHLEDHGGRRLAAVEGHPRRGDVYWVSLDPAQGTEIRKTRPAVVLSNDACNRFGSRVVVVPLTSNVASLYPGEAIVSVEGREARALGDQIRSLDRRRLRTRIARLAVEELRDVETAVRVTLGFDPV